MKRVNNKGQWWQADKSVTTLLVGEATVEQTGDKSAGIVDKRDIQGGRMIPRSLRSENRVDLHITR